MRRAWVVGFLVVGAVVGGFLIADSPSEASSSTSLTNLSDERPVLVANSSDSPPSDDYLSVTTYRLVNYTNDSDEVHDHGSAPLPIAQHEPSSDWDPGLGNPRCPESYGDSDPNPGDNTDEGVHCETDDRMPINQGPPGDTETCGMRPSNHNSLCIVHSNLECRWTRPHWWEDKESGDETIDQTLDNYPPSDLAYGRCTSAVVWMDDEGHTNVQWRPSVRATAITLTDITGVDPVEEVEGTWSRQYGDATEWVNSGSDLPALDPGELPGDCDVDAIEAISHVDGSTKIESPVIANCVWTASGVIDMDSVSQTAEEKCVEDNEDRDSSDRGDGEPCDVEGWTLVMDLEHDPPSGTVDHYSVTITCTRDSEACNE